MLSATATGDAGARERLLRSAHASARRVRVGGRDVHVVERGSGPPLVLLHGTGNNALFFEPMLKALEGVHALAVNRPGFGGSTPVGFPRGSYREAVVEWTDRLLDALELPAAALLGHSMGGLWSIWYALAHPSRVTKLVVIDAPALPGTRAPLPFRVLSTPGLGGLVQRLERPSPASVLRFASLVGEGESLARHPDLVDMMVADAGDPTASRCTREEARAIVSPWALVTPRGLRQRMRLRDDELRALATETLLVWGDNDPTGSPQTARSLASRLSASQLILLQGGHAPWLEHGEQLASRIGSFVCGRARTSDRLS